MSKKSLVVIGNGMVGARTVEELLRRGGSERFRITMFGDEPHGNYNRILLSEVLNGSRGSEDIVLHPLSWYAANDIALHAGVRIASIDRAKREVVTTGGASCAYDTLVLATGSRAAVPPLHGLYTGGGEPKAGVFVLRTLDDCSRIADYARHCRSAVVVGGGLLGLEAARGLGRHGSGVHIVHRGATLMNQQLDATAGAMLKAAIEKLGIEVHLKRDTAVVLGEDRVSGVRFSDGSELACDMVVFSCGTTPNTELARACGLQVGRAVVVDDRLCSASDEHIFAVGECAQHRGISYGLVGPLWEQAQVLAEILAGSNPHARYRGSKTATRLKVMGIEVASMGEFEAARPDDEVITYSEPHRGIYKKLLIREGKLAGAILLGCGADTARLMQTFDRAMVLPAERAALLFANHQSGAAPPLLQMPDEATVCQCNGVTKGALRHAAEAGGGEASCRQVMQLTRAGSGCGSCRTLVGEIVEWVNDSLCKA